jgi:hypothetical protein
MASRKLLLIVIGRYKRVNDSIQVRDQEAGSQWLVELVR